MTGEVDNRAFLEALRSKLDDLDHRLSKRKRGVHRPCRYLPPARARTKDTLAWVDVAICPHGSVACRNYFKCTQVCPKGIKVTKAINLTNKKVKRRSNDYHI